MFDSLANKYDKDCLKTPSISSLKRVIVVFFNLLLNLNLLNRGHSNTADLSWKFVLMPVIVMSGGGG